MSPALAGGFLTTEPPGKSTPPPPPDLYVVWILTLFSSCSGVLFQGGLSKLLAKTAFWVTVFHHTALISSQQSEICTGFLDCESCDPAGFACYGSPGSHQFSSVPQSCLTLCDPMDYSTPGFPVHH